MYQSAAFGFSRALGLEAFLLQPRSMANLRRNPLVHTVIGCALEVHKQLGAGLMESVYRRCLARELMDAGLSFRSEVVIPIVYKGMRLDLGYRADLLVEETLLLEIKSVDLMLPIHSAQTITYGKLARVPQALLLNFNVVRLKDGLRSFVFPVDACEDSGARNSQ